MKFKSQTIYNRHIKPLNIINKEKYYYALSNIEGSWSGRGDIIRYCNSFIRESEILLSNSINLFEMGYFDCAFYSLRTAVELSTTIVFFSDMPDDRKNDFLQLWVNEADKFPLQSQMLKELRDHGNAFSDMKMKMATFFESAKLLTNKLNKYVHKQGYRHFYSKKEVNINNNDNEFLNDFCLYLKESIGVVAVMRLAIDPFPVLLMDEEIYLRCFDSLTEPYDEDFVKEYIGDKTISDYKLTEIFLGTYNHFIKQEKKLASVRDLIHFQYINTQKFDEMFTQLHLMSYDDIVSLYLVYTSEKIVKIYCYDGFLWYSTDRNTNRTSLSYSSSDIKAFGDAESKYNQTYDEVFISVFTLDDKRYSVEHNEQLDDHDIESINKALTLIDSLINKLEEI